MQPPSLPAAYPSLPRDSLGTARGEGWRARLNQARRRYGGVFQRHLNRVLCGSRCPVNTDCTMAAPLCAPGAGRARTSVGTRVTSPRETSPRDTSKLGVQSCRRGQDAQFPLEPLQLSLKRFAFLKRRPSVLAKC